MVFSDASESTSRSVRRDDVVNSTARDGVFSGDGATKVWRVAGVYL